MAALFGDLAAVQQVLVAAVPVVEVLMVVVVLPRQWWLLKSRFFKGMLGVLNRPF